MQATALGHVLVLVVVLPLDSSSAILFQISIMKKQFRRRVPSCDNC